MATGRTVLKHVRVFADGYDLSGDSRSIGPLIWQFADDTMAGLDWAVKGTMPGQPTWGVGTLNAIFNNTATSGLHTIMAGSEGTRRNLMVPIGIRATPADGDPVYCGNFYQAGHGAEFGDALVTAMVPFSGFSMDQSMSYEKPWGNLVHTKGGETGANSTDEYTVDGGAQTTAGGWLMYQIFSVTGSSGSVTISIDDSSDDDSYSALDDATSGAIAKASVPCAGIVQLGTTDTVEQYLRWQMSLTTLTACTFALAFIRG